MKNKINQMHEEDFTDIHEINLPWINALVRIPLSNGNIYRGSMKDLKGSENFLIGNFKTIICMLFYY